jgi:hypothetical protein
MGLQQLPFTAKNCLPEAAEMPCMYVISFYLFTHRHVILNYPLHLEEGESWYPFNVSVRPSVTTERLSKLRKITGKRQARFPLRPLWPPVTGSKKVTVVRGPFL